MDGEVYHGFSNSACEVGYMHMDDSDFQTLGAASILTKKVAAWKEEPTENWSGYHIFEEAKKAMRSVTVQLTRWWMYLEKELPISAM